MRLKIIPDNLAVGDSLALFLAASAYDNSWIGSMYFLTDCYLPIKSASWSSKKKTRHHYGALLAGLFNRVETRNGSNYVADVKIKNYETNIFKEAAELEKVLFDDAITMRLLAKNQRNFGNFNKINLFRKINLQIVSSIAFLDRKEIDGLA